MEVRDVIKQLEQDGWRLARTKGSQRQYHHPAKPGTVTVASHPSGHSSRNVEQYIKAGRAEMKYLVVYEKSPTSWGAYVPDLPGLGVAATTLDEVKELIRETIEFHVEGMREHGDPIPAPAATTEYIRV
jgi:predicted RNA binding protein YcfA (HicA-like mRNA interferase family)/predicted RNase H-like HicB family nuclease